MTASGLEGVVAATTQLSHVDGERGELVIGGYQLEHLAEYATFEETTWLLWRGELPSVSELEEFRRTLAGRRTIPDSTLSLLRECAQRRIEDMDALRIAAGTLSLAGDDEAGIMRSVTTATRSEEAVSRSSNGRPCTISTPHVRNTSGVLTMNS